MRWIRQAKLAQLGHLWAGRHSHQCKARSSTRRVPRTQQSTIVRVHPQCGLGRKWFRLSPETTFSASGIKNDAEMRESMNLNLLKNKDILCSDVSYHSVVYSHFTSSTSEWISRVKGALLIEQMLYSHRQTYPPLAASLPLQLWSRKAQEISCVRGQGRPPFVVIDPHY